MLRLALLLFTVFATLGANVPSVQHIKILNNAETFTAGVDGDSDLQCKVHGSDAGGLVRILQMTTARAAHVNLRDSMGTELGTSGSPLRIDPTGTTPQPVSESGNWDIRNVTGTVSLPTGAATSAKQPALGIAGTSSADVITVQGVAGMTPLSVAQSGTFTTGRTWTLSSATDSVAAVQSGTWNINNISGTVSLPTGAASSVLQSSGNASLASIDSKLGSLGQKTMSGSAPVVIASDQSAIPVTQSGTWNLNNISGTVSLPTGAATATNQGTEIASLQILDDVPSAFNGAFSKGAPAMGQLDDTSTTAATEDNVAPVRITAQRAFHINLRNAAGSEIGTAASPLRIDTVNTTPQTVTQGTSPWVTTAAQSGIWSLRLQDGTGNAISSTSGSLNVNVVNSFAAGTPDQTTFTYGTTIQNAVGGVFNDTSPSVTAGQGAAVRITQFRGLHTNLRNASGVETGTSTTPMRTDPTGTTTQPTSAVGNFNNASIGAPGSTPASSVTYAGGLVGSTAPTYAAGDMRPLALDTSGLLRTNGSGVIQPVLQSTAAALSGAWPIKITDGTTSTAVKAASTAPLATDPAVVVTLSPNGAQSTAALQTTGNASLSSIDGKLTDTSGGALKVDGSSFVQPINATGFVSTLNSSSTTLAANAVYTGTAEDCRDFGMVTVSVFSDVASATGGLMVQWSANGTVWDTADTYSINAATGKTFTFGPAFRYLRVSYTNGSTIQTAFRLQTVLRQVYVKPSSHRIDDAIPVESDSELVSAVVHTKNPLTGTYDSTSTANPLPVRATLTTGAVFSNLAVGTTATEVRVGASPLANRRNITFEVIDSNDCYFAPGSGVTTTTGTPEYKNQFWSIDADATARYYIICATAAHNARISESP